LYSRYSACQCGVPYPIQNHIQNEAQQVLETTNIRDDIKVLKKQARELNTARTVFRKTLREVAAFYHENIKDFVESIKNRKKLAKDALKNCESYKAYSKLLRKTWCNRNRIIEKYSLRGGVIRELCSFRTDRGNRMIENALSETI
jgi:ABC-type uncharacterized transport system ATPase subunit